MQDRQKKVILITLTIIGVVASIGVSIAWLLMTTLEFDYKNIDDWKDLGAWLYANFGSMTLGLILKILVNKKHLREVKLEVNKLEDLKSKPIEEKPKIKRWY